MTKRKSSHCATERMLFLLRYLSEGPHSIHELTERLMNDQGYEYNRVTIQNDLSRLKEWGFCLEVEKKKRVLRSPAFPFNLPEITLNSVRLAFKLLDDIGLKAYAASLSQITKIIPDSQQKLLQKSTAFNVIPQNLINLSDHYSNIQTLEYAISHRQEVEFEYSSKKSTQGEVFLRQVEPISLDWREGKLYLLAYNYKVHKNQEIDFRVDRILGKVKVLPIKFAPRIPMTHPISFRIWGNVGKQYQPSFYREDSPIKDPCIYHEDALLIHAEVTDYFWAKQRLLKYLPFVQVTSPDSLVEEFKQITEEMVKLYLH